MVRASAKGHAWVNFNNKVVSLSVVFFPRRLNNKVFADMGYMEILLPFVCPILLAQRTEQRIAENAFCPIRSSTALTSREINSKRSESFRRPGNKQLL